MRTPKLIKQKHKNGCVPACLAMIIGADYDYVESKFKVNFDKFGTKNDGAIIEFLCYHGFTVERRRVYGAPTLTKNNKLMSKPFADIHLVAVKQFVDNNTQHAIVMTKNGKLLCPSGESTTFNDFYEIVEVWGCNKD